MHGAFSSPQCFGFDVLTQGSILNDTVIKADINSSHHYHTDIPHVLSLNTNEAHTAKVRTPQSGPHIVDRDLNSVFKSQ